MGEYVADGIYRVHDLTIQRRGGTFASFIRTVQGFIAPLKRFFQRTDYNFTKFNYLGEWHSHPSFDLRPSHIDSQTMWEIVNEPQVGANFAILMIVHSNSSGQMEGTVTVYLPGHRMFEGELIKEERRL